MQKKWKLFGDSIAHFTDFMFGFIAQNHFLTQFIHKILQTSCVYLREKKIKRL
jgi:hypothetical protein